jgi:hypothetical protein
MVCADENSEREGCQARYDLRVSQQAPAVNQIREYASGKR